MKNDEIDLKDLLEKSRRQLTKPFAKTRRKLLLWLNFSYICLILVFLISEKLSAGRYVPHPTLGWIYALVMVANLVSLVYNYVLLRDWQTIRLFGSKILVNSTRHIDQTIRWISVISILAMSLCNIIGLGNPSNDAILTDFALGHSLIVTVAILMGRSASLAWFGVVMGLLIYVAFFQIGYSYQYNYLTPPETIRYQIALKQSKPWALTRQAELKAHGLNPPTVSRYFNVWFVFILGSCLTAYFCMGITLDVFKIIPTVTEDIKTALETAKQQELEREREKSLVEEQRMLLKQEALSAELKNLRAQINPHFLFNALNNIYSQIRKSSPEAAENLVNLSNLFRYALYETQDNYVSLVNELNFVEGYVNVEKLRRRHSNQIQYSFTGNPENLFIPPLLLVTFIENAFKHGMNQHYSEGWVNISINVNQRVIMFTVGNNKSTQVPMTEQLGGLGLANVRKRLALLFKPSDYSLTVEDTLDEYWVSLQMHLLRENDLLVRGLNHRSV